MIEKALAIEAGSQERARVQHLKQSEKFHKILLKYGKRWLNIYLKRKKDRKKEKIHNLDDIVKPLIFPKKSPIKTPPRTKIFEESSTFIDALKKEEAEPSYRISEKRILDWFHKDFKKRETLAPRTRIIEKTPEKRSREDFLDFNHVYLADLSLMNSPQIRASKDFSIETRIALEERTREFESKLENYKNLLTKEKLSQVSKVDTISLKIELKKLLREINKLKEN